jgi:hypothetical protein
MKKRANRLHVSRETLRALTEIGSAEIRQAEGGFLCTRCATTCHTCKCATVGRTCSC